MSNTEIKTVDVETVEKAVSAKVQELQMQGKLQLPKNYSAQNALKSAYLILEQTKDRNDKPVLQVCTRTSIIEAMLSMVVQGLNPDKKQCYFIPYGDRLTLSRSYFGSMATAKAVNPDIKDIVAEVIYLGDTFKTEKRQGRTIVLEHVQEFQNMDRDKIIGAYATVIYKDGTTESTVMPMYQIEQAWKQSQTRPIDDKGQLKQTSTHYKFKEEMCKKTVINRACKHIINTSDDGNIMADFYNRTDDIASEASAEAEAAEIANKEMVEVEYDVKIAEPTATINMDTGEIVQETEPANGPTF